MPHRLAPMQRRLRPIGQSWSWRSWRQRSSGVLRRRCRGLGRRRRRHQKVPLGLLRQEVRLPARRPRHAGQVQRGAAIIAAAENWTPQIPRYEPRARIPSAKAASVTRWLVPVDASATQNSRRGNRRPGGAVVICESPRSCSIYGTVHTRPARWVGAGAPAGLIRWRSPCRRFVAAASGRS